MRRRTAQNKFSSADGRVRLQRQVSGLDIIADRLNALPTLAAHVAWQDRPPIEPAGNLCERYGPHLPYQYCDPIERAYYVTWSLAQRIIGAPSTDDVRKGLSEAATRFGEEAAQHPVTMRVEYPVMQLSKGANPHDPFVEDWRKPPFAGVSWRDSIGEMLWHLWQFYFQDGGWERLKRCQRCSAWFVDRAKNKSGKWCSGKCKDSFWNRPRRKNAKKSKKGALHGKKH
jgi:hypothetical protein